MRGRLLKLFLFMAFGFSGAAALIYEVVWTRSLSNVMGSSTYALTTMLAAFMAGLAAGGFIGSRLTVRFRNMVLIFALCELGIGLVGVLSIPVIESLTPIYILSFYTFHLSFEEFSLVQFIINFLIMGVPTTLMGITFPVLIKYFSSQGSDIGKRSGQLYGVNTFGAIVGTLAAGFLLIPLIGVRWTAVSAAALNITTATVIMLLSGEYKKMGVAAFTALMLVPLYLFIYTPQTPFFSYYSANRFESAGFATRIYSYIRDLDEDIVLYSHHGINGDVYVTKNMNPQDKAPYTLLNNGKLEAGDEQGFALLALLPYFEHGGEHPGMNVLNIGLGSGNTLGNLASLPVSHIDSVEISRGVIEANRRLLSPALFEDGRIEHVHADGRNFLLLAGRKYDMIVVSPSWAVEASSAALLTDEFFRLASSRLERDGVFSLWVDNFVESDLDMEVILRTLSRNFKYVSDWTTDDMSGTVITASNSLPEESKRTIMAGVARMKPELAGRFHVDRDEAAVAALGDGPVNTDENPVIEFHNARNIILGPSRLLRRRSANRT
jgi:spermidine synthase